MKKIILIVTIMILLCGCCEQPKVNGKRSGLITYCDEEYGVEYIRDIGVYSGGITVRLDENGNVIHFIK